MGEFEKDVLVSSLVEKNLDINNPDNFLMAVKRVGCDESYNQKKKNLRKIFRCTYPVLYKKYLGLHNIFTKEN
jgi:hypothetical protein